MSDYPDPLQAAGGAESEAPPPPEADPPWGFRDLAMVLLIAVTALFFAQAVGGAAYTVLRHRWGWTATVREMLDDVRFILPVQLAAYTLTVGFIYTMVVWKYRRRFWEAIHWRPVAKGAPGFLLAGVVLAFASQLVPHIFPTQRTLPIERLFSSPMAAYLLALFGILVAPFVEELLFRGVVFPVFQRYWGLAAAVLITAALFAGIHAPQLGGGLPQVSAIFFVGLALGYARGRTGSLVPPYLMHLSYNSTLFVSLYVATKGFEQLPAT